MLFPIFLIIFSSLSLNFVQTEIQPTDYIIAVLPLINFQHDFLHSAALEWWQQLN